VSIRQHVKHRRYAALTTKW